MPPHRTSFTIVVTFMAGLGAFAACGAPQDDLAAAGRSLPLEGYCDALAAVLCDARLDCECFEAGARELCLAWERDGCERQVATRVDGYGQGYDPGAAAECLEQAGGVMADCVVSGDEWPDSCGRVFSGQVPENGSCASSEQCVAELVCAAGRCVVLPVLDEPCDSATGCADGLRCVEGACRSSAQADDPCAASVECDSTQTLYCGPRFQCTARLEQGEPCGGMDEPSYGYAGAGDRGQASACAEGLFCDWDTSRCELLPSTDGALCANGAWCAQGLHCDYSGTCRNDAVDEQRCWTSAECSPSSFCEPRRTCEVALEPTATSCDPQADRCRAGFYCQTLSNMVSNCAQLPGNGQDCTSTGRCADGAYCGTEWVCVGLPSVGDPCEWGFECAPGLFCSWQAGDPVCANLPGEGESCVESYQCAEGWVCNEAENCELAPGVDESCATDGACALGHYCTEAWLCATLPTSGPCAPGDRCGSVEDTESVCVVQDACTARLGVDVECDPLVGGCGPDLWCDASLGVPACRPVLSMGEPCEPWASCMEDGDALVSVPPCASGAFCDPGSMTCVAQRGAEEDCGLVDQGCGLSPCDTALYCGGGWACMSFELGVRCDVAHGCADGFYCPEGDPDEPPPPPAGEGGASPGTDTGSGEGFASSGQCAQQVSVGESCQSSEQCAAGLWCNGQTSACEEQQGFGSPCQASDACRSGECVGGICGYGQADVCSPEVRPS